MEKAIESDISITNVVNDEVDVVAINEVPVEDVQVHVSESVVVDGIIDPSVVVVGVTDPSVVVADVNQVKGEIR